MKSKDNDKDKITLESIDKRLKAIEKKFEKLPSKKETESYFNANLLYSFALVLVAVTIPLIIQATTPKEILWVIIIPYFILAIGFILLSRKLIPK